MAVTAGAVVAAALLAFTGPVRGETVVVELGAVDDSAGLENTQRGDHTDGENDPDTCGPGGDLRSARRTRGAGDDDFADAYMYFLVTNPDVKRARRLEIRATLFDDPAFADEPLTVRLDYTNVRSTGPSDIPDTFSRHPRAWTLSGTGRWVRHAWSINDAGLRTFMQGSSDFRFDVGRRSVCVHRVEVTAIDDTPPPEEVLVGAHYYPWYDAGRWSYRDCVTGALRLELRPPEIPVLGRYDSSSDAVVDRHLRWCAEHGISVLLLEFIRPGGREDTMCREVILRHPRSADVSFAVMYDWAIRFGGETRITPARLDTAAADFAHLAREYFPHPSYLRHRGRPVALIYITRALQGDVAGLIGALRDACAAAGADVFLAGDEFFFPSRPRAEKIAPWDAIFGYDCYGGRGGHWSANGTLDLFRTRTAEYRETAAAEGVTFFPSILPGFNDRAVRRVCASNPALPRRIAPGAAPTSLFATLLETPALPNLDAEFPLVAVTSFNEWHEDTQIEPTAGRAAATAVDSSSTGNAFTEGFVYDDYGTAFLEVVRDTVLAVTGEVRGPAGPVPGARLEVLRGDAVVLARRTFSTGRYTVPRLRLQAGAAYRLRATADGLGEVVSPAFTVLPGRARTGFDLVLPGAEPAPRFVRADANADGEVDISDPVATLGHLFLGGDAPRCMLAADANDDDVVDISDAISTLAHLFLGTGEIPAPGAATCGEDPTPGVLGCAGFPPCDR